MTSLQARVLAQRASGRGVHQVRIATEGDQKGRGPGPKAWRMNRLSNLSLSRFK